MSDVLGGIYFWWWPNKCCDLWCLVKCFIKNIPPLFFFFFPNTLSVQSMYLKDYVWNHVKALFGTSNLQRKKKCVWDPHTFSHFISLLFFFLHLNTCKNSFLSKFFSFNFFPPNFYLSKHRIKGINIYNLVSTCTRISNFLILYVKIIIKNMYL